MKRESWFEPASSFSTAFIIFFTILYFHTMLSSAVGPPLHWWITIYAAFSIYIFCKWPCLIIQYSLIMLRFDDRCHLRHFFSFRPHAAASSSVSPGRQPAALWKESFAEMRDILLIMRLLARACQCFMMRPLRHWYLIELPRTPQAALPGFHFCFVPPFDEDSTTRGVMRLAKQS